MEIWPRSDQRPSATQAVATRSRFTRCRVIARVPSATALVPAPGVTTTAMPRRVASSTSTRSTPTPVRATTFSSGVRSRRSRVDQRIGPGDRAGGALQVVDRRGWPRTSRSPAGDRGPARAPRHPAPPRRRCGTGSSCGLPRSGQLGDHRVGEDGGVRPDGEELPAGRGHPCGRGAVGHQHAGGLAGLPWLRRAPVRSASR